jgi:hypothetical protein
MATMKPKASTSSRKSPRSKASQALAELKQITWELLDEMGPDIRAELLNQRGSIDRAKLASLATKLEGKRDSQTVAQAAEFLRIAFLLLARFDDRTLVVTINEYRGPEALTGLLAAQVVDNATESQTEESPQGAAKRPGPAGRAKGTGKARH